MISEKAIRERVKQFSNTLALALNDKKIEGDYDKDIIFYYDNDVVYKLILGFEHERLPRQHNIDEKERLVRALMSYGYLGQIHLLRPHALELNRLIFESPQSLKIQDEKRVRQNAFKYLKDMGVSLVMQELLNIISGELEFGKLSIIEKENRFLEHLSKQPGNTFAYLAQAHGGWAERFYRFRKNKLIKFNKLGPEVSSIQDDLQNVVFDFYRILIQRKFRQDYTINTYTDSLALGVLTKMINDRDIGDSEETIRFYTETNAIRRAIQKKPELRKLLCYKQPRILVRSENLTEEYIIRNSEYYLMRGWFQALSPNKNDDHINNFNEESETISGTTINDLEDLLVELESLLVFNDKEIKTALSSAQFKGKSIIDFIETFEQLTIMDSVWIGDRFPQELRQYDVLKDWVDVIDFASTKQLDRELQKRIDIIRSDLETKLLTITKWMKNYENILTIATKRSIKLVGKDIHPMRDLGLVRWGYVLEEDSQEEIRNSFKSLSRGGAFERAKFVSTLVNRIEFSTDDLRERLITCAILWGLTDFEGIVSLVGDIHNELNDKYILSLWAIKSAAQMRRGDLSLDEVATIVDQALKLKNTSDAILLSTGYILFHAWQLGNLSLANKITSEKDAPLKKKIDTWAKQCFDIGKEAFLAYPGGKLAWAYSINHCAYVGTMTGVYPDETEEFVSKLFELKERTAVWNYHFTDTLGCVYISRAEKLLKQDKLSKSENQQIKHFVSIADEHLTDAENNSLGDIASVEHREWLNRVTTLMHTKTL